MKFEWDEFKETINQKKHGMSFNKKLMKTTSHIKTPQNVIDDMLPEYDFDYRKAKPNRFAEASHKTSRTVVLDPDIAEIFTTSEAVNTALRALLSAIPKTATS